MTEIDDYVKNNTKSDRQKHIDLKTECIPSVLKKDLRAKKAGDYTCSRTGMNNAKELLKEHLNLSGTTSSKIHTCHLCDNNSMAPNGFVCMNPKHLYFGTNIENNYDLDLNGNPTGARLGGKLGGKIGGKKTILKNTKTAIANGNHISQQTHTCPHCSKSGNPGAMKRWHFDNCKFKGDK